jgi:excisionase family DNA binding protein
MIMSEGGQMEDRMLSIGEVAQQLGVHVNTVRQWANKGLIDHVKLPSGYRRFTQAAVDKFKCEMVERGKRSIE